MQQSWYVCSNQAAKQPTSAAKFIQLRIHELTCCRPVVVAVFLLYLTIFTSYLIVPAVVAVVERLAKCKCQWILPVRGPLLLSPASPHQLHLLSFTSATFVVGVGNSVNNTVNIIFYLSTLFIQQQQRTRQATSKQPRFGEQQWQLTDIYMLQLPQQRRQQLEIVLLLLDAYTISAAPSVCSLSLVLPFAAAAVARAVVGRLHGRVLGT